MAVVMIMVVMAVVMIMATIIVMRLHSSGSPLLYCNEAAPFGQPHELAQFTRLHPSGSPSCGERWQW